MIEIKGIEYLEQELRKAESNLGFDNISATEINVSYIDNNIEEILPSKQKGELIVKLEALKKKILEHKKRAE